jgi:hypothetical protein
LNHLIRNVGLPNYVFEKQWGRFVCFDSAWIFKEEFSAFCESVLKESKCAIRVSNVDNDAEMLEIAQVNDLLQYKKLIQLGEECFGWSVAMQTLVISGNSWVIYVEQVAEIAILAGVRGSQTFDIARVKFRALSVEKAVDSEWLYAFHNAPKNYLQKLKDNYADTCDS